MGLLRTGVASPENPDIPCFAGKRQSPRDEYALRSEVAGLTCEFFDFNVPGVDSSHGSATLADRSFVFKVVFAVISDASGVDGQRGKAVGFAKKLPGEQGVFVLDHQVPVLATVPGVM